MFVAAALFIYFFILVFHFSKKNKYHFGYYARKFFLCYFELQRFIIDVICSVKIFAL